MHYVYVYYISVRNTGLQLQLQLQRPLRMSLEVMGRSACVDVYEYEYLIYTCTVWEGVCTIGLQL